MAKWPIPLTHRTEQLRRRLNDLWRAGEIGAGGTSGPASNITSTDINNWDAAFGWGDHAAAGYLTAVNWGDITGTLSNQADLQNALNLKIETETDPTVPAHVKNITTTQIGNWDVAFDRSPTTLTLAAGDILTLAREGEADLTADLSGLGGNTVPADSVGVDELDTDNTPTDGQVLAFNAATNSLVWVAPATSGTALTLTSIDPTSGDEGGGTTVTATGTFDTGAPISFTVGGTAATSPTVVDSTTATFDTPAGTGASNDVVVTQGAQSDTLVGAFGYVSDALLASESTIQSVGSQTWTHNYTLPAGADIFLITVHSRGAIIDTVTFGGVAATLIAESADDWPETHIYGIARDDLPAPGADDLVVTWGALNGSAYQGATSVAALALVDDSMQDFANIVTGSTFESSATSVSTSVTLGAGEFFLLDAVTARDGGASFTPGAGQTQLFYGQFASPRAAGSSEQRETDPNGSVTLSWSGGSGASRIRQSVVALKLRT